MPILFEELMALKKEKGERSERSMSVEEFFRLFKSLSVEEFFRLFKS
jgi:hypothetical protein